jgi:hypothetical protein
LSRFWSFSAARGRINTGFHIFRSPISSAIDKDPARIDEGKIASEARFDGKWGLRTDMALSSEEVALKYKQL